MYRKRAKQDLRMNVRILAQIPDKNKAVCLSDKFTYMKTVLWKYGDRSKYL